MVEASPYTPYEERVPFDRPPENPHHFDDPTAQAISDKWWHLGSVTPAPTRDQVGIAYMQHFLNVGEDVAERFASVSFDRFKHDNDAYHKVGLANSGRRTSDIPAFWEKIKEILPDGLTSEDLSFLTQKGGEDGVLSFIFTFGNIYNGEPSVILRDLHTNAHAYK